MLYLLAASAQIKTTAVEEAEAVVGWVGWALLLLLAAAAATAAAAYAWAWPLATTAVEPRPPPSWSSPRGPGRRMALGDGLTTWDCGPPGPVEDGGGGSDEDTEDEVMCGLPGTPFLKARHEMYFQPLTIFSPNN